MLSPKNEGKSYAAALGPMSQMLTRLILSLHMHIGMYMCINVYMIYLCVYRGSGIKIETAEREGEREGREESFLFPRHCHQSFNFCNFPQRGKRIVRRICPSSFIQHDNCLICFSFFIFSPLVLFFPCCSVWILEFKCPLCSCMVVKIEKLSFYILWDSDTQRACADPVVRSPSLLLWLQ